MTNQTNNAAEIDLTCQKCDGEGVISGMAGRSGYGDPEEDFVTEECDCFAGTLRCGCCLKEEAVTIVADGTPSGLPLGERCRREQGLTALDRLAHEAGKVARAERPARGAA